MSYDVIETLVTVARKNIQPASVVQLEGEIQFTRYLPLEMDLKVTPFFQELKRYIGNFNRVVTRIQDDFILCGYYLNHIKRNGLYRYCIQEGLQGYVNFYKFCEEVIGVSTTTAKRLIAINSHFCNNGAEIPEQYKRFGASKLAIMATFKNGLEGKLQAMVTTRQLDKLSKYYAAHDWSVRRDTTWNEDLAAYEREQTELRLAKSARLKDKHFEAVAPVEVVKKPRYISDPYNAFTKFFDDTLKRVDELKSCKDERFSPLVEKVENVLKAFQSEVLKMQANEMLDGL